MVLNFLCSHIQIECPILTWSGGDMGSGATLLSHFLKIGLLGFIFLILCYLKFIYITSGDPIRFEAVRSSSGLRASRWVFGNQSLASSRSIAYADSNTQTVITPSELFFRYISIIFHVYCNSLPLFLVFFL